MEIKIAGIDPGFVNNGLAIGTYNTDTLGVKITSIHGVKTKKTKNKIVRISSDRLRRGTEINAFFKDIIPHDTQIIFAEIPTGSQSAQSSFGLGIAVGILSCLDKMIIQVMPSEVKRFITGKNTASKAQVVEFATDTYPGLDWPVYRKGYSVNKAEHMADAIAIIHAGIRTEQFRTLLAMI